MLCQFVYQGLHTIPFLATNTTFVPSRGEMNGCGGGSQPPALPAFYYRCTLQTKTPDILSVYSTSRQYVGEYAGNLPAIVPNSLDSHYSQSNNRSTSPYIREESYMFEYTDTLSVYQATRYRGYTGFFICREYIG